ncbi:hypothetical protein [Mycobacterium sp.]|uniref:hypothetical protein n=1 Tax=Mycobacterium sp. TaxID=1785 RepID=UPI003450938E|nr:hypothetical protein [Mycobacterium sp.]
MVFLPCPTRGGRRHGQPVGMAVDTAGNLYVADEGTNRVWKLGAADAGRIVLPSAA